MSVFGIPFCACPCSHPHQVWCCWHTQIHLHVQFHVLVPHLIVLPLYVPSIYFLSYVQCTCDPPCTWCNWDPSLYLGSFPVPKIFLCSSLYLSSSHVPELVTLSVHGTFRVLEFFPFQVPRTLPCTWHLSLYLRSSSASGYRGAWVQGYCLSLKEWVYLVRIAMVTLICKANNTNTASDHTHIPPCRCWPLPHSHCHKFYLEWSRCLLQKLVLKPCSAQQECPPLGHRLATLAAVTMCCLWLSVCSVCFILLCDNGVSSCWWIPPTPHSQ